MQHLVGYGLSKDPARVACVVKDTELIPLNLLETAMRLSRQMHDGNFPPAVGQIVSVAKKIDQTTRPERSLIDGSLRAPDWYRAMKKTQYNPRQIAASH